jgi:1,5-anhydro-D-fructose reductase (1,5-anhydro-D-mannitol-forming)
VTGVAIVGSSGHAARIAAPVVAATPGARLAGVLGSTPERGHRLARDYERARAYAGWEDLLADDGADAVWIAGPNHLHASFAQRCMRAGKHVLLEKPMATTHADAQALVALDRELPVLLAVGFQHRFRPAHRWLREALSEGLVGDVRSVRVHRFWPYSYFEDMPADASWRTSPDASGGWALNDIGAHLIDLAAWLLDARPHLAFAHTTNHRFRDVATEDTALLALETDRGAVISIETSNAMASFPGTIEVHGLAGWARADGTFDGGGAIACHDGQTRRFDDVTSADVYAAELRDFLAALDGAPSGNATAQEAADNVAIVEAAVAAHRA